MNYLMNMSFYWIINVILCLAVIPPVPPAQVLPPTWGSLFLSILPCFGPLTSSPEYLSFVICSFSSPLPSILRHAPNDLSIFVSDVSHKRTQPPASIVTRPSFDINDA